MKGLRWDSVGYDLPPIIHAVGDIVCNVAHSMGTRSMRD